MKFTKEQINNSLYNPFLKEILFPYTKEDVLEYYVVSLSDVEKRFPFNIPVMEIIKSIPDISITPNMLIPSLREIKLKVNRVFDKIRNLMDDGVLFITMQKQLHKNPRYLIYHVMLLGKKGDKVQLIQFYNFLQIKVNTIRGLGKLVGGDVFAKGTNMTHVVDLVILNIKKDSPLSNAIKSHTWIISLRHKIMSKYGINSEEHLSEVMSDVFKHPIGAKIFEDKKDVLDVTFLINKLPRETKNKIAETFIEILITNNYVDFTEYLDTLTVYDLIKKHLDLVSFIEQEVESRVINLLSDDEIQELYNEDEDRFWEAIRGDINDEIYYTIDSLITYITDEIYNMEIFDAESLSNILTDSLYKFLRIYCENEFLDFKQMIEDYFLPGTLPEDIKALFGLMQSIFEATDIMVALDKLLDNYIRENTDAVKSYIRENPFEFLNKYSSMYRDAIAKIIEEYTYTIEDIMERTIEKYMRG